MSTTISERRTTEAKRRAILDRQHSRKLDAREASYQDWKAREIRKLNGTGTELDAKIEARARCYPTRPKADRDRLLSELGLVVASV